MSRFRKLLATAIGLCFAHTLPAQQHYNSWFRATISYPVNAKIKTDAEFQHRRQNGFGNDNMLDKNLMFTFRNWVHYQYNQELRFSVSPFAYFTHYRVIENSVDGSAKPFHEVRFSIAIDNRNKINDKWCMLERSAIEYRMLDNRTAHILRLRNRFGIQYAVIQQLRLSVYDELFCNVSGVSTEHFFDHNRVGFMLDYNMSSKVKLEIGYIYINRLLLTEEIRSKEHDIMLNLAYQFRRN